MPREEPGWWYAGAEDRRGRLLGPIGRLYGRIAVDRFNRCHPYRSRLPVICVGNFTAGGTGKTPLALCLADLLTARGETPVFLTRGYGGRLEGPVWVTPGRHSARDVGDEPLLLAVRAPVMLARNRRAGAEAIERGEVAASVIIMDDGLQNPLLAKDLTLAVVDSVRGVGNARVIPAGPLRAPLEFQLGLVDAIVVNGRAAGGAEAGDAEAIAPRRVLEKLRQGFTGPVLRAEPAPAGDSGWLEGARVLAYAGIGNPGRFFALLEKLGATVVERHVFADHHGFSEREARRLLKAAGDQQAQLVTTEKDWARLEAGTGDLMRLREGSRILPIRLAMPDDDLARLKDLVATAVETGGYRRTLAPR